jgi:hypothetical protein
MSAIDGVSEIFDPEQWDEVPGFEDLTDLTYHRARAHGTVRIAFDEIRPNPYFQPPGANTDAPLDVSEVTRIGFAPQDQGAGRLMISRIVVVD